MLAPIAGSEDRSWLTHSATAHGNGPILEDDFLADGELMAAVENHRALSRTTEIINTDRSVCARLAGELAQRHGNRGFKGQLDLTFRGAAGQSFGAFLVQGMNVRLEGEANDYVGKGMNSGRILWAWATSLQWLFGGRQASSWGGGMLMFQALSYTDALDWLSQDPMTVAGLVVWQLQEWIPVTGDDWP